VLHRRVTAFRDYAAPVLRGSAFLALITLAAYRLHLNSAAAGFLYLVTVTLNCLDSGFIAAAIVSVLAVACLDYFFVEPLLTWTIADPVDAIALASFLITSLVITRLSSKAREQARTATQGRRNMERLYEAAQRLVASRPSGSELPVMTLEIFRSVFGFKAACLFEANSAALHAVGDARADLRDRTRETYILGRDADDPAQKLALRCLRASGKIVGAIGFEGLEDARLIAGSLAALAAAGLDRAIAVRTASQSAAEAQAETLRAAILDALAHEFKTPLAAILTAAGGLRESGPLGPEQSELAEIVETEAERLSHLSSRLLRLGRLDRDELKPRFEPTDSVSIVAPVIDRYSRQFPDRELVFEKSGGPDEIMADTELLQLALSQLIDNACRYSPPGSRVKIAMEADPAALGIVVWNSGSAIPAGDSTRIFDRFYRGTDARRSASGSGLGLYVARKIALAHGGSLDLDPQDKERGGVAFRLTVPMVSKGSDLVARTE
jgi:two-component system, OmpR family, sensor histidine kinase KdpD